MGAQTWKRIVVIELPLALCVLPVFLWWYNLTQPGSLQDYNFFPCAIFCFENILSFCSCAYVCMLTWLSIHHIYMYGCISVCMCPCFLPVFVWECVCVCLLVEGPLPSGVEGGKYKLWRRWRILGWEGRARGRVRWVERRGQLAGILLEKKKKDRERNELKKKVVTAIIREIKYMQVDVNTGVDVVVKEGGRRLRKEDEGWKRLWNNVVNGNRIGKEKFLAEDDSM